ncbi:tRNA (cytosine-5-)-methyltransferase ncl1 [Exophiala dermatitidis]|uniref:Methyltransferase (Ncl1) n=3 Tax=Exophiala dermatitidis TaxID=5970 RepID=H6BQW1_EXODN|nr:methyltransferase (Ncl1) [Exophiala dermatitidis NIH/UT8656]KAJ4515766.1 tRNA (cytosine-5-)-methyltransferase ncl1 [Exophiala dermatitidis]EHY53874.1 methyltransferase (Ncl1) [Exophiala dermatitidis NIH/UT8656]KAJ4519458.1 tRNA (cytosine-5-)-methyltransferase ncl1 [Exophiala dermatitidis]KAJ4529274.1 tRNA (cytosine-5-)-methyltransferase ncl1 [Exophiala dermatitidis]KAJ4544070.1 tRNA (cytosine-5-)-methyltransferase ncl1 [Exophiala dermatitidis]
MGKRGGKKGGRGGGRGGGGHRPRQDNRTNKAEISRYNEKFEEYYNQLGIIPEEERSDFWEAMRRDLPNSFRFTGSKAHALAVQQRLRDYYIPEITSITYEGQYVEAPRPVEWYPDQLAWYMTTPKNVIRRFKPFANFQKFLVAETDVGNITRQEVVSMIPPLLMDLRPGMTVLDLCAAPGSKSAQLIEMIHAGEEERCRQVAANLAKGLDRPEGEDYEDDGRATGLLIANDVDYKRAHMLVHQVKRLSSPNILVSNHDATIFPSIKVSPSRTEDGKLIQNRYLKFDRILADVPCSGDGTVRKNMEIWKKWAPSNGLGLHATQVRILIRALQMLKVGGRVVYSTCSMNPVEDEAVLAEAINRCGGSDLVQLLETKDYLPGLKRSPGLKKWNIMDKAGRVWNDYESVLKQKETVGEEGLGRLAESMFPPKNDLPLDRAMRVYPHKQDTGAFFIAILEKRSEIKARPEEKPAVVAPEPTKVEAADFNSKSVELETAPDGTVEKVNGTTPVDADSPVKRKRSPAEDEEEAHPIKRVKSEEQPAAGTEADSEPGPAPTTATNGSVQNAADSQPKQDQPNNAQNPFRKRNRDQPFEEPFKYLSPSIPELAEIKEFYNLSPRFPNDRYMVRNAQGTATKNIYYTNALAKEILQENEGKGLKFVHAGVKMYVKQDAPAPDICPWRIQTDGLRLLEAWVGPERIVKLRKKETLRRLLIEMFPRFNGEEYKKLGEVGEQILPLKMGCCVLVVEPSDAEDGLSERMVFPLWKSLQSVNLMLPKEDRRAMLLRLFNDDTPLVNLSKGWVGKKDGAEKKADDSTEKPAAADSMDVDPKPADDEPEDAPAARVRNSSSPESEVGTVLPNPEAASADEEDGGVEIS